MTISKGFGLIDIMIAIAICTILLAVALPSAGSMRDGAKVARIIDMADDLARASHRFQVDTGRNASELSASADGKSYTHPRHHELSMPQAIPGWQGPYIERPLTCSESPTDGPVYLVDDLGASPANGFELEHGDRIIVGAGQMVIFHGVARRVAQAVDLEIDGEDGGTWHSQGRVEWVPDGDGCLSIFLTQFEPRGKLR